MKKYILALAISAVVPAAQAAADSAAQKIEELRQTHEESLDRLLKKYLKEENILAVSEVGAEMKRIRSTAPQVETGKPPVGCWTWNYNHRVTIGSNGLTIWNDKSYGIWKWINEAEGKGEIKWDSGYIDTFTISPDGKNLHIVNNLDHKYVAGKVEKRE